MKAPGAPVQYSTNCWAMSRGTAIWPPWATAWHSRAALRPCQVMTVGDPKRWPALVGAACWCSLCQPQTALVRMHVRCLSVVHEAALAGRLARRAPEHARCRSALVAGNTAAGGPVHQQVTPVLVHCKIARPCAALLRWPCLLHKGPK